MELMQVIQSLRQIRVPVVAMEYEIHDIVAEQLRASGIPFEREASLGPRSRIDFLIPDGAIGVEVKKGVPTRGALERQLERYTSSGKIQAVILVVERKATIPRTINGKPCVMLALNKLWGIAL
jgi:DNA-binding sugar fermentation-stimulating protein